MLCCCFKYISFFLSFHHLHLTKAPFFLVFFFFQDLFSIGVTAFGPRKKILHALSELRKGGSYAVETNAGQISHENGPGQSNRGKTQIEISNVTDDETSKQAANKLITDFFPGLVSDRKKVCTPPKGHNISGKGPSVSGRRCVQKNRIKNGKLEDIPTWCCIPGTPFRVVMVLICSS